MNKYHVKLWVIEVLLLFFVIGLAELHQDCKNDYSSAQLNSICEVQPSPGDVSLNCFKSARPLESMLTKYYFFSAVFRSNVFVKIWSSKLKIISKMELRVEDIPTSLWEPVFTECCQLLEDIHSQEIRMKDIEQHLGSLSEDNLCDHLCQLNNAMRACSGKKDGQSGSNKWIRSAVDKIKLYRSLSNQAEAAKTVLELRDSLHLAGDFGVIEDVAFKVNTSMREASLKSIDEKIVQTKTFLEHFTKDRLECLKAFSECLGLIEWIRKETEGIHDSIKYIKYSIDLTNPKSFGPALVQISESFRL